MRRYRVAIVGLGRMGSTIDAEVADYPPVALPYSVAASCHASERLELVAGADVLPEKRAAFGEKWGVDALYDDYRQMIERERPDIVAVCTRGPLHSDMAVTVAEAGVPMLYLEKAMACSMREADAVLDACRRNKTVFNTGVLRRFDSRYHAARRVIERGEIGEPRAAVHYAATNLLHGHIHSIDTLLYLLGDPRILAAYGELRPRETAIENNRIEKDPHAVYRLEVEGGVEAVTVPAGGWEFEVIGSEGALRSGNNGSDWSLRRSQAVTEKYRPWQPVPFSPGETRSATLACLEDLVASHESGGPTLGHVEIAHHTTEACFAVAESHRRGGTRVELPLAERDLYIHHV